MAKISQFGLYSEFLACGGEDFLSLDCIVNFFFMSHEFVLHVAQMARTVLPTLQGGKMCAGNELQLNLLIKKEQQIVAAFSTDGKHSSRDTYFSFTLFIFHFCYLSYILFIAICLE